MEQLAASLMNASMLMQVQKIRLANSKDSVRDFQDSENPLGFSPRDFVGIFRHFIRIY
jgi:hypothetical protein